MRKLVLITVSVLLAGTASFAQLTGIKTIPGTYPSMAAAIADLNTQGVGPGGVTFNIAAGYTETFTSSTSGDVTTSTGSAGSPIIFQKSGSGANPVITAFQLASAAATSGIIKLAGTDYVTFDGIDVSENPLNTTFKTNWGYAILMAAANDASQHITIKNCSITLDKTNTSSRGIYSGMHTASSTTTVTPTDPLGTISFCDVDNCNITNVYTGISFNGYNAPSPYSLYGQSNRFGYTTGNNITNFGGGSVQPYAIFTIYQNNIVVANNTINGGVGTTVGLNGIYLNTAQNANVDIYYNTLTLNSSAGGANSMYGIYNAGGSNGTSNVVNIHHNTVENCLQPNAFNGNWYLINNAASALTVNINDNIVRNNSRPASGGNLYLFYNSSATIGTENIFNNLGYGNSISFGATSIFYGLYCNNNSSSKNIYDNAIYNNSTTGSSGYGIFTSLGTTVNISRNKIYGLSVVNTNGLNYGIRINGGTNVYCVNNVISDLTAPNSSNSTSLRGISADNGTNIGLYYNTIYLNGSSSGAVFGSACVYASISPALEMRNNILVNMSTPNGTGSSIAYWRVGTTLATYSTASGNNDFYAGVPGPQNLVYFDGTTAYQTLADYKTLVSPADINSFTELPPFTNTTTFPYDLHISAAVPTQCESGGGIVATPVSITTDHDNIPRFPNAGYPNNAGFPATAPDAGAYEFAGISLDLTPPGISYTPLSNTSLFTNRTLTASIVDPSGVPTSGSGSPVCYWKINAGAYTAAQGTWVSGNNYTFSFGSGVVIGDIVSYYIVAQDMATPPNVGANPSAGSSGFTANPPACSTPPSAPNTYTIITSLSGVVTVGLGGTYPSLTGAGGLFQDINSKVLVGNLTAQIISNLTEDGANSLNKWIEDPPGNFTLTIQPDGTTERLIEGTVANTMIRFTGAQNATIDGRYNGSGKYFRFRNNNTGFGDFEFSNDARFNILRDCIWEGGNTSTATASTGIIRFYLSSQSNGNSNNQVINNVIRDLTNANGQPYTSIFSLGSSSAYNSNNTLSGNEILNFTSYGIYISSNNGDNWTISGNSLYNNMTVPLTTTPRCLYFIPGAGSNGSTISGNYIGGSEAMCGGSPWTINSTGGLYGIYLSAGSTVPTEIYNNVLSNFHNINTGAGSFYMIYCTATGDFHIGTLGGNIIGSATTANSLLFNGTTSFRGIFVNGTSPANTVENNIIGNVSWSVASGTQSSIHGIYVYAAQVRKNKVFNIGALQPGFTPTIYGLYDYGSTSGNINEFSNNIVDLDGGAAANPTLYGFWENATGASASNLYFNTIYIHGPATATSSTYAWRRAGAAANTLKNNIFFNDRASGGTGSHYAVYDAATATLTSDYNDLNSTAGPLGYSSATNILSLADWQTATSGDANSVSVNPLFVSSTDLHPTVGSLNNTGVAIAGITTDFSGVVRNVPPDMGALEFNGDPAIVTTAATAVTSLGATLNGTVNAIWASVITSFNLGLTTSYGTTITASPSTVTGNTVTPISATVGSLAPSTTYHFRAVGQVSTVSYYGNDMTFTTSGMAPAVITTPATGIGIANATLNGTVNANNQNATVTFEYGLTTSYGTIVTGTPGTVSGMVVTPVSSNITGLAMNTTYHFRVVAVNATGTSYGNDLTFTTGCLLPSAAGPITGSTNVCQSTTGVTYTVGVIANATSYAWSVPAGAAIVAGAGTNSITVDYGAAAVSGTVSVYGIGVCGNGAPSSIAVTVNPQPVPVISGPSSACAGLAGNVYTTDAGMTNYSWTISSGGTITSGAGTNSVTVTWSSAGAQTVSVTYTNAAGCTASIPTVYNVTVNAAPVPTITGQNSICANSGYISYSTEAGMTGYNWATSAGGTIVSGQGTSTVQVAWNTPGAQTVSVNYTNANGCQALTPTTYNVTVNSVPAAAGTITGTATVCGGAQGVAYSVAPISGAIVYVWTLPAGASIATGANTNAITVDFAANASSGDITVMGNNLCGNGAVSPDFAVTVNALPADAGTITGDADVCVNSASHVYSVPVITGATDYTWNIPAGAVITAGANSNAITVTFGPNAGPGTINVTGVNSCGSGTTSPDFAVTVHDIPPAPVVTLSGNVLTSSAPEGNQWYFEGTAIPGATEQTYTVTNNTGYYSCVVTLYGCSSPESNQVWVVVTGQQELQSENISIYPVPNDGRFTVSMVSQSEETFSISVYNNIGVLVGEVKEIEVNGQFDQLIDLRPVSAGMYTVVIRNGNSQIIKKIIVRP